MNRQYDILVVKTNYYKPIGGRNAGTKRCKRCRQYYPNNKHYFYTNAVYYTNANNEIVKYVYSRNICKICFNEKRELWLRKKKKR